LHIRFAVSRCCSAADYQYKYYDCKYSKMCFHFYLLERAVLPCKWESRGFRSLSLLYDRHIGTIVKIIFGILLAAMPFGCGKILGNTISCIPCGFPFAKCHFAPHAVRMTLPILPFLMPFSHP